MFLGFPENASACLQLPAYNNVIGVRRRDFLAPTWWPSNSDSFFDNNWVSIPD